MGASAIIWSLWLCINDKIFNNYLFFFSTGYLPVHCYASFMDTSAASGASGPLYGGVFTIGGYGEGYFLPTWVAA
jgi:hypothetical protein